MTKLPLIFALAMALAACGQKPAEGPAQSAETTMAPSAAMPAMAPVSGHGAGTVKAIDPVAGTVTLEHGPIPEAKWPAMTMAFMADAALLGKVAVGDEVLFEMKTAGGVATLTSIAKQ